MQFKITNGTFAYSVDPVFKNIDFEIKDNEKIAICGRNGSGKTTLLKLITGELEIESNIDREIGSISKIGIKQIGYLKQIVFTDESITLEEEIMKIFSPLISMQKQIESLQKLLESEPTEKNINDYYLLEQKFKDNDGYFYKKEYNSLLKAFKFSEQDKLKKIGEFSGGQKTKIAFIKLLLSKPDILLLDEPTNHLDMDSIEWLENYLSTYKKSIVLVSHDRDFLDKVVNIVYEIEYGKLKKYVGNYTSFVNQKKANYEKELKEYKLQQNKIEKEENLIEKFRYKATKASMVQSRIKSLEKMEKLENPEIANRKTFHFNLTFDTNSGNEVLNINNLKIGYNNKVLSTVNLKVLRGEKVGIIGENGIGKSTLLKTLIGQIPQIDGSFSFGYNTSLGYFEQLMTKHTSTKTIFEDYTDEFPKLNETQARNDLGSFLFTKEEVTKKLNELSGGEMVRLQLLKIFKKNPNVLLLDEPTNHMDLIGKETLEEMLQNYKGTILVISHDRYFIRKVTNKLLVFEKDGVKYYEDGYKQYLEKKEKIAEEKENIVYEPAKKVLTSNNLQYLQNKEKAKKERMLKNLEEKIKAKEDEIKELNILINTPIVYENVDSFVSTNEKIKVAEKELSELLEKWCEESE